MRPAAKFATELAHRHHPHRIGILLAEQHHRAGLTCFGKRHDLTSDRIIRGDLIDHILCDLGKRIIAQRFLM